MGKEGSYPLELGIPEVDRQSRWLTLGRIVLVPVFGALWLAGRHGAALVVFVAAALSDVLGGS